MTTPPDYLIVEDGSGVADANAYISVANCDLHHLHRGNSRWAEFSDIQKQTSIIRATDYIDKRFGPVFRGARTLTFQPLEWPRLNAVDDDGFILGGDGKLPKQLVKGIAEYALRAAIRIVLAPDPLQNAPAEDFRSEEEAVIVDPDDDVSGFVVKKTVKVGPVEESIQYQTAAQAMASKSGNRAQQSIVVDDTSIPEYPEADMWLEALIVGSDRPRTLMRGD